MKEIDVSMRTLRQSEYHFVSHCELQIENFFFEDGCPFTLRFMLEFHHAHGYISRGFALLPEF